ncbi:MAG: choloylglycine hydrolase family protein [Bacteroidota bacterium]
MKKYVALPGLFLALFLFWTQSTNLHACTGITLKSVNGSFIQARTMEWGAFDMQPEILVFPRNYQFESELPAEATGMKWRSKYGFVGINALGKPEVADGLNEKGLAVSVLYLPGYASYQPFDAAKAKSSIGPTQVAALLLANCESTQEVRTLLAEVRVVPVPEEAIGGIPPPLHYMVADKDGNSIVVEYTDQQLHIYDNPVGVLTNSPSFPWHLTNLNNYVTLGINAASPVEVGDLTIKPLGAGSGMLGLPGDYTPPSRFVRATAMRNTVPHLESGERAVAEAFRILNSFDIPIGTMGAEHDPAILGDTQYTTAADTKSLRYYYRTMHNHRIRVVDLTTIDFNGKDLMRRSLDTKKAQDYETVAIK